ncbi:MAG: serine/threonine protein kinase, partial [Myxococcales bacterium]|nr:serine/threonine protein kinase [Myxococcales bacterium]
AQAMARLSHPNIVTVHEVGEHEGRVFVAMEFVRGMSLDAWLDAVGGEADGREHSNAALSDAGSDDELDAPDARGRARAKSTHPWRDVLAVFRQAGLGLQAAHAAGIIHRDFKPHNALLAEGGAVKVLDFGLARGVADPGELDHDAVDAPEAGGARLLDVALTRTGAIMGTPAYMSPEQHLGLPATAASDQFSFCVALYEALYGQLPFACTSLAELIHRVTAGDVREPPAGSSVPSWVRRVILRGLAADVDARYPSMLELLAALDRDPSAQRRRWLAASGLVVVTAAGSVGAMSLRAAPPVDTRCHGVEAELAGVWDDARREAARAGLMNTGAAHAESTWLNVQASIDRYAADWVAASVDVCEDHRDARQSDAIFDLRTACLASRRAGLDALAGVLAEADGGVLDRAVEAAAQLPSLARCDDLEALASAVALPEDPAAAREVREQREQLARARVLEITGKYADAAASATSALEVGERLAYEPLIAEASLRVGSTWMNAVEPENAEAALARALWTGLAVGQDEAASEAVSKYMFVTAAHLSRPQDALALAPLAETLIRRARGERTRLDWLLHNNLAYAQLHAGAYDAAEREFEAALQIAREQLEDDPSALVTSLSGLAVLEGNRDRLDAMAANSREAIERASAALGAEHPKVHYMEFNLGYALRCQGEYAAPRAALTRALSFANRDLAARSQFAPYVHNELGRLALSRRDYAAARVHVEAGLDAVGATPTESHRRLLATLGDLRVGLGDVDGGLQAHRESRDQSVSLFGDASPEHAESLRWLAGAEINAGLPETAIADAARGVAILEALGSTSTPSIAESLVVQGEAQLRAGQRDAALASLTRARSIFAATLPPGSAQLAPALRLLGDVHQARGERDAALAVYREAITIFAATRDADDPELALARFALARALAERSPERPEEARALAQEALDVLGGFAAAYADEANEIRTWLNA